MSEEKNTICNLCQKVLGVDEEQSHHCAEWCDEPDSTEKLKTDKKLNE